MRLTSSTKAVDLDALYHSIFCQEHMTGAIQACRLLVCLTKAFCTGPVPARPTPAGTTPAGPTPAGDPLMSELKRTAGHVVHQLASSDMVPDRWGPCQEAVSALCSAMCWSEVPEQKGPWVILPKQTVQVAH